MSSNKILDNRSVRPKIRSKHSKKSDVEPLERTSIRFEDRDGIERYYPALHIKFSHTMVFTKYWRPPLKIIAESKLNGLDIQNNETINNWITNAIGFQQMIETLLRLQHNQFWSTLIHEKSLQICLESYLRSAPRDYDSDNFLLTDQMKDHIKRIHNLVFKLYLRVCSINESKLHFISESFFGTLIYNNYLIDVPKIIDLCVLYSNTNYRHLLSQMIANVIQCQPQYEEDLTKSCANICGAFLMLQQKVGSDDNQSERTKKLSYSQLQSIVNQITDISVSLEAMIQTIPQMSQIFKKTSIDKSMVEFYNRFFPSLQNQLNSRLESIENNDLILEQTQTHVITARSHLIVTFRLIVENCFLNKLMDKNFNLEIESKVSLIDGLVETLTLAAFEKCFIIDYYSKYPVESDFEKLSKHSELLEFESFDKTRIDYLKSIIQSNISFESKTQIPVVSNPIEEKVNGFVVIEDVNEIDVELESRVQYIKEIMPELGPAFIEQCLNYYDGDNEKVLNAILENNLPPHLESMDRTLQKSVKTNGTEKSSASHVSPREQPIRSVVNQLHEVIENRDNVYNNDEFDLFRNKNVDLTRIHSGKKNKTKTQSTLDNTFKEKILTLHQQAIQQEEDRPVILEPWTQNPLEYEDEFDDTYEDDTQIDVINDKLIDELDVNEDKKDYNKPISDNNEQQTHYSKPNYRGRPRNYNNNRNRSFNRR